MAKRSKRDPIDRQEHYTQLIRSTMETPAWRALPATAQALYPWFKLEWRGPNNNKNGKLRLSVRQAAAALGVSRDTAARAIHELQAKGFLHMTEAPCLGTSGAAKSPAFEITEIALPSANPRTGRKLYLEWREGHDFAVSIIASNNPQGLNGKTKPCPKNQDGVVLKMMTK
ncbi:MAG: helix-turn-helix domain-containing protein [Alphaproteobacteria bacterium]|nr:helix-turn-helix domain-containing protein [Alphaproteobacteria bacterium]MBU1281151.1 helix-turn-helix domain-containing protein [Alphaproteobacteria bacterium]MBU1575308.1 helix-turn-helix domain-containing protein [Alphaproteobacteria bacterium]MBU1829166.1 helix-turn-helix domain-containing protein [Alphaproteobacteria bacterium]MBU2079779.1 helix-turn-helix domain-containing protein [Alphaproteobacteria bacterium]